MPKVAQRWSSRRDWRDLGAARNTATGGRRQGGQLLFGLAGEG